jgi:elongation factor 4
VRDGSVKVGDLVACASTRKSYSVKEVGVMVGNAPAQPSFILRSILRFDAITVFLQNPEAKSTQFLNCGQVGYMIVGMRTTSESKVGDTVFAANHDVTPFPGFQPAKPMACCVVRVVLVLISQPLQVFAGVFPMESGDGFESLQSAINRLTLNDASVSVQRESSVALGMGFRCGFLGLLHMEVFKQRLFTEFGNGAIVTNPTVPYKIVLKSGAEKIVSNPTDFPRQPDVAMQMEPMVNAIIMVPLALVGDVMKLCKERRGTQTKQTLLDPSHVMLEYYIPLAEVVTDFCDDLKSKTSGFASLDYEDAGYREAPLCLLEIMLNGKEVDSLSSVVHRDNADSIGRSICSRLKDVMGRQQFDVAIQASVNGKVIARETLKCYRKNVLVKSGKTVGGGDVTRKQKLLQKQKEGKKMMKRVGEFW